MDLSLGCYFISTILTIIAPETIPLYNSPTVRSVHQHLFGNFVAFFFAVQLLPQRQGKLQGRSGSLGGRDIVRHHHGILRDESQILAKIGSGIARRRSRFHQQPLGGEDHRGRRAHGGVELLRSLLLFQNGRQGRRFSQMGSSCRKVNL